MMNNNNVIRKYKNINYYIIILILIIFYIYYSIGTFKIFDINISYYFISPFLWTILILFIIILPKVRIETKLKYHQSIYWWAFNLAIINIFVSIVAGFIDGLGKSPYSHTIIGIIQNIISVATLLIGRELARNYLVNEVHKKENKYKFLVIVIFMTITNISIKRITEISKLIDVVIFIAETFGPIISLNLIATYLVSIGGTKASIIYLGIIECFHWLSPVLPNLQWITSGFIGILTPLFSYLVLRYLYEKKSKKVKSHENKEDEPLGWILTCVTSIAIIWFSLGVFPIFPSVIATGSMEPMINPGDVILIEKVDRSNININIGDVIQFERGNLLITHRVIDIEENKEEINYITKGDNNSRLDSEKVKPNHVKGKIKYVIPKIGWPTLLLKMDKNINMQEIEF